MRSPVASRRLALVAAARSRRAEFLHVDPSKLRFSLGTSLGDLRIPVHIAPDAEAIVRGAAAELALLLSANHRFVPPDARDGLVMHEQYAALPAVLPRLGPTSGGAALREAATLGPALHPALTGGIVCAWMGPGGRGRSLTALFIEVLRRAFAEMATTPASEPTPLLVALALHAELAAAESLLGEALPAPPHDRYLRAAAGAGLWLAARTGMARAFRETGRPEDDPFLLEVEAVLSPGALVALRGVRSGGDTLYGVELTAGAPRGDELAAALAAGADPDTVVGSVAQALAVDEDGGRKAELAVVVAHLRDALTSAVVETEAAVGDRLGWLRELLAGPGALAAACAEEGGRRDLARRIDDTAAPGDAARLLAGAAQVLKEWRAREPSLAIGLDPGMARREYARAAGGYLADAALERLAGRARRATVARTGEEAEGGADAEWEAGRLYRVAVQGEILRVAQHQALGHLFTDVKDFTRRTALLGPAVMAEFLRSEFYRPILGAAKKFYTGMAHLSDRGGISVNNLLGDAISLSGDIEAMVGLAAEIRRLLAGYESRLRSEISRDAVARQIAAIEQRHAAGLAKVRGALALAKQELAGAAPGTPQHARAAARTAWLAAMEERLASERERALARARGEGLEAGVFVSFGAAPLVVIVDDD
ncbi:MAG TPA: hypothetical protein VFK85_12130, partial [Anaeromyxobacteraceae bacterium]|nr:hypothetical protein [Anaeromyxobacteraceae bacterium]